MQNKIQQTLGKSISNLPLSNLEVVLEKFDQKALAIYSNILSFNFTDYQNKAIHQFISNQKQLENHFNGRN